MSARAGQRGVWGAALAVVGGAIVGAALLAGSSEPSWPPVLTPEASRTALRSHCAAAKTQRRALLVEFSAPWCEHCQGVAERKRQPAVSKALEPFERITINVGEGHALDELRRALGARAIPYWAVIEPIGCDGPFSVWPRRASIFPTGSAQQLAAWLTDNS